MALRANHYDAAFEDYLRRQHVPYVVVDEARRTVLPEGSLKSLDFVVRAPGQPGWLVDVKGRRATLTPGKSFRTWESWVTAEDLESLARWEEVFGAGYRGLLVFAYWVESDEVRPGLAPMHRFRDRSYVFYGVWAGEYRQAMQVRSPSWNTVWVRRGPFQDLRFPLAELVQTPAVAQ